MKKNISVIGLGYVGSPLAVALSSIKKKGKYLYNVFGLERNSSKGVSITKNFNKGKLEFITSDSLLKKYLKFQVLKTKNLQATYDPNVIKKSDIILITIGCDLTNSKTFRKKFQSFIKTLNNIFEYITENSLIILESTVPPGTCENFLYPNLLKILKRKKIQSNSVFFAYSYERVMPGKNYFKSITNYWRVYAGINELSTLKCAKFYKNLINTKKFPLTKLQKIRDAELAKILENSYRAVNIALIEEWRKFSENMSIDLNAVLNAIRKRPTHRNIMNTGFGVGGYCLTKDPLFGKYASKLFLNKNSTFKMSEEAIKINYSMPNEINKLIMRNINKNSKVLVVGVSYKKDIGDTRFAPSEKVINSIKQVTRKVNYYDPYLNYWKKYKISSITDLNSELKYDLIIFLVNHEILKKTMNLRISKKCTLIEVGSILNKSLREKLKKKKNLNYINYK